MHAKAVKENNPRRAEITRRGSDGCTWIRCPCQSPAQVSLIRVIEGKTERENEYMAPETPENQDHNVVILKLDVRSVNNNNTELIPLRALQYIHKLEQCMFSI